jgi:hypothetical protein
MILAIAATLWALIVGTVFWLLFADGIAKGYTGGASR